MTTATVTTTSTVTTQKGPTAGENPFVCNITAKEDATAVNQIPCPEKNKKEVGFAAAFAQTTKVAEPEIVEKEVIVYADHQRSQGIFGLTVGGHRGPKERVAQATSGLSLGLNGGAVVNTDHVGIGVMGIARLEQARGVGSMTYSVYGDGYSGYLDVAPVVTFHTDSSDVSVNGYAYAGPGVSVDIKFAEVAVGAGVGLQSGIMIAGYDFVYRARRADYDQFAQILKAGFKPVKHVSFGVLFENTLINPDDGLATSPRNKVLWGAGGGAFVAGHVAGGLNITATGGVMTHSGLHGSVGLSYNIDILQ
jgi:hypothetical protein